MPNKDVTKSKFMRNVYPRAYFSTRGLTGIGAELRDLRQRIDALALLREVDSDRTFPLLADFNEIDTVGGKTAGKVYHPGIPEGYEKASKTGAYTVGKNVILTAVKPGELGNEIKVTWGTDVGAASVSVFGTDVVIKVKADDSTTPAALQVLIAADKKLKQLVALTSTDNTAITAAWAAAAGVWTLAGGTGLGWGCDIIGAWGHTSSIGFLAAEVGRRHEYEVEWTAGAALAVTADRKKLSITFVNATTTVNAVVAAVNANGIAREHLLAFATGDGAGVLTGLGGKSSTLTTDAGTILLVGEMAAMITEVTSTYVKFDLDASALLGTGGGSIGIDLRLGLLRMGGVCVSTAPDDIVADPAALAALEKWDGRTVVVRESAGVGTPPALYVYNVDATAWQNLLSTGLPAAHASTHQHTGTDEVATATPGANAIPKSTASTYLADGWIRVPPTAVDFGVTAPYAVLAADKTIEVTTAAVSDDVDLPTAVGCSGRIIVVKKIDAGVGTVSVDPNGVEVIEALGAGAPYVLTNQGEAVTLQSNGAQWYVLAATVTPAAHANTHRNAGTDPFRLSVTTPPAGAYAVLTTDEYVRAASLGAGAVAVTLYAADAAAVGRVVRVQKVDAAADDVNVTPNGAELINGVNALYALAAQWNSVTLLCVAVGEWEIIATT